MTATSTFTAPHSTVEMWYPAEVMIIGEAEPRHNVKVYATNTYLMIYKTVPTDDLTPDWWSPIDWSKTPRQGAAYNGININTEHGLVVVTQGGGCGCGDPLKRWHPQFSRVRTQWP